MGSLKSKLQILCVVFIIQPFIGKLSAQEEAFEKLVECESLPATVSLQEFVSQLGDHELVFAKQNKDFYSVFMLTNDGDIIFGVIDPRHQFEGDPHKSGSARVAFGKIDNEKVVLSQVDEIRTIFNANGVRHIPVSYTHLTLPTKRVV